MDSPAEQQLTASVAVTAGHTDTRGRERAGGGLGGLTARREGRRAPKRRLRTAGSALLIDRRDGAASAY